MPQQILLIDDDTLLRRSLTYTLERAGFRVTGADDAETGLACAALNPPDLVLLDIGLPGMDGLAALREFLARGAAPVIFLTARRRQFDEVLGLELGADDYIVKPFDPEVLVARVRISLRRAARAAPPPREPAVLTVGDLVVDPATRMVSLAGEPIEMQPRTFDLLYALASRPGQVIPIDRLLTQIWGAEYRGQPQVIYVHVHWLREKLEQDPDHPRRVITVHSAGYKLVPVELPC